MIRKKKVLRIVTLALVTFSICIYYSMYVITGRRSSAPKTFGEIIEGKIKDKLNSLPGKYKIKHFEADPTVTDLVMGSGPYEKYDVRDLWREANSWLNKTHLYVRTVKLGAVLGAMKRSKIIGADLSSKGTQLKFLLTLEGEQKVIFKPKRYEKEVVIEGVVYAGKDRYGSEILGFYLSLLLNRSLVPLSVERKLDMHKDVLPLTTEKFLKTTFTKNNETCVYGDCYYCTIKDPVCTDDGYLFGAVIFYVNYKFKVYKNPWRRTYKKNLLAPWETDKHYCKAVLQTMTRDRILDLIDVSIFDFLLQNGDRHHYEVYGDTLVWLDNGKGLGNPYVDHIDILAPLYECCMVRRGTWTRLQALSGGVLTENLKKMPDIANFVFHKHFEALERRLLLIYATVELCIGEERLAVV